VVMGLFGLWAIFGSRRVVYVQTPMERHEHH